jgi:WD40 repeat protein
MDAVRVLATFEDHEDGVYSVAWSAANPWTIASVSWDGRVVIGAVPADAKNAILL